MPPPSTASESRSVRLAVWTAFVIVVLTDFAYWLIIRIQESEPPNVFTVPFVAAYLGLTAAMLGLSLLDRPLAVSLRPAFRAGAAAGLLAMGVLALMSIGILLVVAAVIAAVAAARSASGFHLTTLAAQAGAAIVAVTVLLAGFEVTDRLIVCPANGSMSGGGPGFVTAGYHYECVNGRLYMHSGFCNGGGASDSQGNLTTTNTC
jgi:hypothetical protein